jgi:adenylate kinase family enzyme
MRRIVVIGCPGSGKTTLALRLGRRLALPVVHLDVLFWRPGGEASDTPSFRDRVSQAIAGDAWIVDGSFPICRRAAPSSSTGACSCRFGATRE